MLILCNKTISAVPEQSHYYAHLQGFQNSPFAMGSHWAKTFKYITFGVFSITLQGGSYHVRPLSEKLRPQRLTSSPKVDAPVCLRVGLSVVPASFSGAFESRVRCRRTSRRHKKLELSCSCFLCFESPLPLLLPVHLLLPLSHLKIYDICT